MSASTETTEITECDGCYELRRVAGGKTSFCLYDSRSGAISLITECDGRYELMFIADGKTSTSVYFYDSLSDTRVANDAFLLVSRIIARRQKRDRKKQLANSPFLKPFECILGGERGAK